MKKLFFAVLCITVIFMAGTNLKAQEVTITLFPGWNWISYPNSVVMSVNDALGTFTPMNGDKIKGQFSNSSYLNGYWRGGVTHFIPGLGYMYYSARTEVVEFVFANAETSDVVVTTLEPTDITTNSATCGGNVTTSNGDNMTVVLRGICWGTNPNPTFNDNYIETGSGLGSFTVSMTELTIGMTYYVRAFVVTATGVSYGEELSFTTSSPGILNGVFSVSENNQVYFSQGNLQYQASTDIWRFAENQWDYMGYDNANISPTYDGWIDLFGWGTSGWDNGNTYYHPWDSDGSNQSLYGPPGGQDLTGAYANADWGVYNSISNGGNQSGLWRTLTKSEWSYVLFNRSTSSGIRYARATVNDIIGVILVPDDWNSSTFPLNNTNQSGASFNSNIINISDWVVLESNGAVFLPITGFRNGETLSDINTNPHGYYWSTTFTTKDFACYMYFWNYGVGMNYNDDRRNCGHSVRLVCSAESMTYYNINVTPNSTESGTITGAGNYAEGQTCTLIATANNGYIFANWIENGEVVSTNSTYSFIVEGNRNLVANFIPQSVPMGAINGLFTINEEGNQVYFSQGNLQYQASTDTWRFAENQHDIIGNANSNIFSTYDGWIDLFGWGTSGYHDANDPYNVNYQPWSTSTSQVNSSYNYWGYGPSTNMTEPNLTGASANYDWGVYNPISNGGNTVNQWRTLTLPEWSYVFNTRTTTSGIRYARANVNSVNGVILLPDDWSTSTYSLNNTNNGEANFSSNTITTSQWATLESAGAVFLPAAGYRCGTFVDDIGSKGDYWSASSFYSNSDFAPRGVYFDGACLISGSGHSRYHGFSVRVVCPAEN